MEETSVVRVLVVNTPSDLKMTFCRPWYYFQDLLCALLTLTGVRLAQREPQ